MHRRRSLPKERVRRTVARIGAGPRGRGTWNLAEEAVAAQAAPVGDGSPYRCGPTSLGDGESCPGVGRCLWSACKGRQPPKAWAQAAVGGLIPYLKGRLMPLPRCPTGRVPTGGDSCTSPYSSSSHNFVTQFTVPRQCRDQAAKGERGLKLLGASNCSSNGATPPIPGGCGDPSPLHALRSSCQLAACLALYSVGGNVGCKWGCGTGGLGWAPRA